MQNFFRISYLLSSCLLKVGPFEFSNTASSLSFYRLHVFINYLLSSKLVMYIHGLIFTQFHRLKSRPLYQRSPGQTLLLGNDACKKKNVDEKVFRCSKNWNLECKKIIYFLITPGSCVICDEQSFDAFQIYHETSKHDILPWYEKD